MMALSKLMIACEREMFGHIRCDGKDCTRQATAMVSVHAFGKCKADDVNPAGEWFGFMCSSCARETLAEVERILKYAKPAAIGEDGTRMVKCRTCERSFKRGSEAVRMQRMWIW